MRALILGVTGQDGSYLAEQLLDAGVEVCGMVRRPKVTVLGVRLVTGDLLDQASVEAVLRQCRPDVVYNLAAVTAPGAGWGAAQPPLLAEVTGLGVVRLLDAMVRAAPDARLVHASSSAIYEPHRYGLYGVAKVFAHDSVVGYRHQLHASNAVFFSHSSPRQDSRFLMRRITSTIARVAAGQPTRLVLGDVDSRRDWGYAPDYVRALPLIAAQASPGDYVIATGRAHSVREITDVALAAAGLSWDQVVDVDPRLPRVPHEIAPEAQDHRLASSQALGWSPQTSFREMVASMVTAEGVRRAMKGGG